MDSLWLLSVSVIALFASKALDVALLATPMLALSQSKFEKQGEAIAPTPAA